MDYLLIVLNDIFADERQVQTVFVAVITVAFFLFGIALTMLAAGASNPLRRRLKAQEARKQRSAVAERLVSSLAPVSDYVLPTNEAERSRVREDLLHGGYRGQGALMMYYAIKLMMAIALPAIFLSVAPLIPSLNTGSIIFFTMFCAFVGVMGPNLYLQHKIRKRQRLLRHGFPDALDLLVVCVEAGLGLSTAIQRVAEEIAVSHPELADDLMMVSAEVRAGVDNVTALRNLATRTGLEDIRGLVSLLGQSLRFGTSIADTLRVYSDEFRDKRMQAAEEQAAKIGTKLIFPLVLCLFPAFFVVVVGPAIIKVLNALGML